MDVLLNLIAAMLASQTPAAPATPVGNCQT